MTLDMILLIIAAVLFFISAFGWPRVNDPPAAPAVHLGWLGLALVAIALI